jgi:hypothetical protein
VMVIPRSRSWGIQSIDRLAVVDLTHLVGCAV